MSPPLSSTAISRTLSVEALQSTDAAHLHFFCPARYRISRVCPFFALFYLISIRVLTRHLLALYLSLVSPGFCSSPATHTCFFSRHGFAFQTYVHFSLFAIEYSCIDTSYSSILLSYSRFLLSLPLEDPRIPSSCVRKTRSCSLSTFHFLPVGFHALTPSYPAYTSSFLFFYTSRARHTHAGRPVRIRSAHGTLIRCKREGSC